MKKSTKMWLKQKLAWVLIVLISINSFAAVVGDSDGTAFVTKIEFENLKEEFNQAIDNYNNALDNKIDGAIASYLQGIKVASRKPCSTGFDLVGKDNKLIMFLGRTTDWNWTNDLYARDKIVLFANGGYSAGPDHYVHDTYDNWIWEGQNETGNASNTYFLIDKNRCVEHIYWNVAMYLNRFYAFFSTQNARDGITWSDIEITLKPVDFLMSETDAGIDTSTNADGTFKSFAKGRGHSRVSQGTTNHTYSVEIPAYMFTSGRADIGMSNYSIASGSVTNKPPQCVVTPQEVKARRDLQKQYSILMSKNESNYGIHICYNPTQTIHSSNQEWNTIGIVTTASNTLREYDVRTRLEFESGYWAPWTRQLDTIIRKVFGYGLRFHELLDDTKTTRTPKWTFNDIYYKELNKVWNAKEKLKYTGGFPVYMAESDGTLELSLTLGEAKNIIWTTSQNTSMPTTTGANVRVFDYKKRTDSAWTSNVKNANVSKDTLYDFKIEVFKNEIIYFNIDSESGNVSVKQTGSAYWAA